MTFSVDSDESVFEGTTLDLFDVDDVYSILFTCPLT